MNANSLTRVLLLAALSTGLLGWLPPASSDSGTRDADASEYVFLHRTMTGLFSATRPVIAILAGELFVGEAEGHIGGEGTLAIHAQNNPSLTCVGEFISSAARGGTGHLVCSNGNSATFRFQREGAFRGYGTGTLRRGVLSFAYGYTHDEAVPHLQLPVGKRLVLNGTKLAMVDR
jgi:hypothetical protein